MTQPPPVNAYLRTRVLTASPEELRLMLLDGAVKFASQGRAALESKQWEAAFTGLSQCRDIVFELMTTIRDDVDPALAEQAKALYSFIYRHIVEGGHEKDTKKVDTVIELLEYERETWVLLMKKLADERGIAPAAEPPAISVQA